MNKVNLEVSLSKGSLTDSLSKGSLTATFSYWTSVALDLLVLDFNNEPCSSQDY